jgi:hypothetical protein
MVVVEIVNERDWLTVPVTATVSSVIIFTVIVPVSPNVPAIERTELVADDGLTIVVLPVPWKTALEPILTCIHLLAGITAVPEVNVMADVVVATPHVKEEAVLEIRASVKPEHAADVDVAKSILVVAKAPIVHPAGKVILMFVPAATPVGVTN